MDDEAPSPDWKLQLRYGRIKTPFTHYTALADGVMKKKDNEFGCPLGPAWMAMKTWAADTAESADMIRAIGGDIGFEVSGDVQIYTTEAAQPPRENPFGYDIIFKPYQNEEA